MNKRLLKLFVAQHVKAQRSARQGPAPEAGHHKLRKTRRKPAKRWKHLCVTCEKWYCEM